MTFRIGQDENMGYIIALLVMCALYVLFIFLMKYMKNVNLTNALLIGAVFIPYLMVSITVYRDVGFFDWNFQNTLPVANVSPFMFTLTPIAFLLPKTVKKHFMLLISLLSVGMLLSGVFGCIYNAARHYKFHIHFIYDYIAHFALSLLGVYLVKSKQVTVSRRSTLISSSIIVGAATVMLILNVIFDTAFFGLSLNGKHNIYNNVLVEDSYLSALIYYVGLCLVLLLGFAYSKLFCRDKGKVSPCEVDKS